MRTYIFIYLHVHNVFQLNIDRVCCLDRFWRRKSQILTLKHISVGVAFSYSKPAIGCYRRLCRSGMYFIGIQVASTGGRACRVFFKFRSFVPFLSPCAALRWEDIIEQWVSETGESCKASDTVTRRGMQKHTHKHMCTWCQVYLIEKTNHELVRHRAGLEALNANIYKKSHSCCHVTCGMALRAWAVNGDQRV